MKSELRFNYTQTLQCLQADNRAIRLEMGISEDLRFLSAFLKAPHVSEQLNLCPVQSEEGRRIPWNLGLGLGG